MADSCDFCAIDVDMMPIVVDMVSVDEDIVEGGSVGATWPCPPCGSSTWGKPSNSTSPLISSQNDARLSVSPVGRVFRMNCFNPENIDGGGDD